MNLFTEIAQIYATLTSVIIAGVLNMIFIKLPIIESLKKPIDQGKYLRDGTDW